MPPNSKGGKGYKKHKKGDSVDGAMATYIERQPGQMIARVIRLLGNRNVLCFCNDNRLRICHICGKMKGRVWIEPGDVVLVSLREFETQLQAGKDDRRGDILAKYAPEHLSRLRRDPDSNQKLFMKLETAESLSLEEVGVDKSNEQIIRPEDDLGGFVFDDGNGGGSDEEAGGAAAGGGPKRPAPAAAAAAAKPKVNEIVWGAAASKDEEEVDIDAL